MSAVPSDGSDRVRGALAGQPVTVTGFTFVPPSALEELRWGSRRAPALVAAACGALSPDFAFVPAHEVWADEAVDRIAECGVAAMWVVDGPFTRAAADEGWTGLIRDSLAAPGRVAALLDAALPASLEQVRRGVRLGAAAVVVADDIAAPAGPLLAPDFVLDELVPRYALLAEEAAQHAVPSVYHSDGDVRHLFPALARAGFAAVHPGGIGWDALEEHVRAARAAGLQVIGGLPAGDLRRGASIALEDAARAVVLASAGGLLIADDGGITTSEEVAALVAAMQSVRRTGGEG